MNHGAIEVDDTWIRTRVPAARVEPNIVRISS
jgi:hypothetical protein